MQPLDGRKQAIAHCEMFAAWQPALGEAPISDFSGSHRSTATFCEVAPPNADYVRDIVQAAIASGVPLRTRAQGHSLNGSSLPAQGELLLRTERMRRLRFDAPGTVTAGSGIVLWLLQAVLRSQGFDLPVLNDGYPGPSVGGYVCAGGFGPESAIHGGIWDNVTAITLVDGRGEVRRLDARDDVFPWLFGSMGQLGVIVDVTLSIIPLQGADPRPYPLGKTVTLPPMAPVVDVPAQYVRGENERLFWFTLFVPDGRGERAHEELLALEQRHASALRFAERYRYHIRHRGRVAPLVYPEACSFTATGAWGWLGDSSPDAMRKLFEFDGEFMALATGTPGYRRYVQSELPGGPAVYERCFGEATYARFRKLKATFDPGSILNRGSVFPGP